MGVISLSGGNPATKSRIPPEKRELCSLFYREHVRSKLMWSISTPRSLANLSGVSLVAGFVGKCSMAAMPYKHGGH